MISNHNHAFRFTKRRTYRFGILHYFYCFCGIILSKTIPFISGEKEIVTNLDSIIKTKLEDPKYQKVKEVVQKN